MASSGGSAVNFNRDAPVIDYTSLDFNAAVQDLTAYAQATYSDRWTDFNPLQFAVVFLDISAYFLDLITFYVNAGLRETTTPTAQRRSHILTKGQQLGYTPGSASQASTSLTVVSNAGLLPYAMAAATTQFGAGSVVFQPAADYTITTTPQTIQVIEGQQFQSVVLGSSTGAQAQQFVIPNSPLVDGTLIVYVGGVAWTKLTTLTNSSPGDQVYRTTIDDEGNVTVFFGDGVNGKVPPISSSISASYTVGGGVAGNVNVGTITNLRSVPAAVQSVTNPAAATGGSDQETIEQARANIPANLASGDRCVNLPDYAIKSLKATSSVAKAAAFMSDNRTVRIVIAPSGGGLPSDTLKNTVLSYLSTRRMAGHRVRAVNPFYVNLVANIDLFVTKSAKASDIALAAQALFLTANSTDQQNGILDYANVGFGARTDAGDPQLTVSLVDATLAKLNPRGLQTSRINQLTTIPQLKPIGITNSLDAALAWTFTNLQNDELVRRRFRIQFTSPTTYNVYEGIIGHSTQLTRGVLTDDRALFPLLSLVSGAVTLNPNTDQSVTLSVNKASSTGQTIVLTNSTDDLYAYAVTGDTYRLEWAANPTGGTVGVSYAPIKADSNPHGFSWIISGTSFSTGDQYYVDVFAYIDDMLLDVDELPQLTASNLTINVRSAY